MNNSYAGVGLAALLFLTDDQLNNPRFKQATEYVETPKNHELHISKATAKRKRKAGKLRALKGQQHDK